MKAWLWDRLRTSRFGAWVRDTFPECADFGIWDDDEEED